MKKLIFLLFIITQLSCEKIELSDGTPECITNSIKKSIKNSFSCKDKKDKVDEYSFQGRLVYVFYFGQCGNDIPYEVVDSECEVIGSLGGFTGNDQINGESFSNAKFVRTVWEKK
jgi:hypothetical protein